IARKQGNNTYYIYQETYREKVNKKDSGTTRGSGKSRVRTRAIYLGTAEKILECVKEKRNPVKVKTRNFGLIAAAYQTALKIGLPQILEKNIQGKRFDTKLWIYFFVTIINRLDHATSKEKMCRWLKKTILAELMNIDPNNFTGKKFWYATDDVISEKKLQEQRKEKKEDDDPFESLDDSVFTAIETELFYRIDQLIGLSPNAVCYDTTNFFTYIEEPKRSKLANTCHSKDSKHHLRHVGLLMAVEKSHGIPLISRIYRANCHDSKLFSFILTDLIISLKKICGQDSDLVLILDKGNNSKENFSMMEGKIKWVGALVPSHYEDLIDMELDKYHGIWKDRRYYRCRKKVMDIDCVIVLTFYAPTKRKQMHSLKRGIEKLKDEIVKKWDSYKKIPECVTPGINTMKEKSRYGACIEVSVRDKRLHFEENTEEIKKREKRFGKNLIFSNILEAETGYLIDTYNEKNMIEDDFQLLKDNTIIRFQPIRHWTDSKIRAYAFCCVVSMILMRVMQWMTEQQGYKMSANVFKDELTDIQEVIMVYSASEAERKITERSAVQDKLWRIFKLEEIEKNVTKFHYTN
ncbi:MAG: IS1634 family transposase, partial [Clostridiales bacterium]|nr:IS1634 family transposase [Clostridiales bacterium]